MNLINLKEPNITKIDKGKPVIGFIVKSSNLSINL